MMMRTQRNPSLHVSQYHSYSGVGMFMRTLIKHVLHKSIPFSRPDAYEPTRKIQVGRIRVSNLVSFLVCYDVESLVVGTIRICSLM